MTLKARKEHIQAAVAAARTTEQLRIELQDQLDQIGPSSLPKGWEDDPELIADIEAGVKEADAGELYTLEEFNARVTAAIKAATAESKPQKSTLRASA